MRFLIVAVIVLAWSSAFAQARGDRDAVYACEEFRKTFQRYTDGVIDGYAINVAMRSVYHAAERSGAPGIREAAAALVRTSNGFRTRRRQQDDGMFGQAGRKFLEFCTARGLASSPPSSGEGYVPNPTTRRAPLPGRSTITEEEADRQLRSVLEREKATDAKCTKKQYGTGWATVCE